MQFDFAFGSQRSARRRDPEAPARLLLLSDLRGQSTDPTPLADRPVTRVDVDNIGDLLNRYAPSVIANGERLEFRTFDDFHPDTLVARLPVFGHLRDLRARLANPRTSAAAIAELNTMTGGAAPATVGEGAPGEDQSTLERLLGRKPSDAAVQSASAAGSSIERLIRDAVAPHIVPAAHPQLPDLLAALDLSLGDAMRGVLHDPGFQAVEAAWRGIAWLVSSLELGEDLELYVLHVTRDELPRQAAGSDLWRRLVEREGRGEDRRRFSAILGNYRFDATSDDLTILQAIGDLAGALDAPFVAECGASLLGSRAVAEQPEPREWQPLEPAIAEQWRALRTGSAARRVGLAMPRFLLRLPYGRRLDPVAAFDFEEQPRPPEHESFLWGTPAFACAVVIARVFQGDSAPEDIATITDLPAFAFEAGGEDRLQPCAEVGLGETGMNAIVSRGIMPLLSFKDRNAIRLARLQSIADPPAGLFD